MTHNSCHEVTTVEFCDWMEVDVEVRKKKEKEGCTSPLRVEARCIRPSSAERVAGWICIHGLGPWENVSLGCIVSHIRSHLENHSPTSPCSSSLSPPLALPVHSRTNTQKNLIHRPHSSWGWVIVPVQSNFTHKYALPLLSQHTHLLLGRAFIIKVIRFKNTQKLSRERNEGKMLEKPFTDRLYDISVSTGGSTLH